LLLLCLDELTFSLAQDIITAAILCQTRFCQYVFTSVRIYYFL